MFSEGRTSSCWTFHLRRISRPNELDRTVGAMSLHPAVGTVPVRGLLTIRKIVFFSYSLFYYTLPIPQNY